MLMFFSAEDVRVGMPIGYITDYYPQWYWDNKTQSYRGFFIDYLDEIFNLLEPDMKYELVIFILLAIGICLGLLMLICETKFKVINLFCIFL